MKKQSYIRLKGALADAGISNKKLAQAIGVTESTVSTWCSNEKLPSIKTLFQIAKFLNIDVKELLVSNVISQANAKK